MAVAIAATLGYSVTFFADYESVFHGADLAAQRVRHRVRGLTTPDLVAALLYIALVWLGESNPSTYEVSSIQPNDQALARWSGFVFRCQYLNLRL